MSIHVVVMGVAGCGKSTVAEAIHERLGYVYAEGDDFHPQANIDKMSAGIPLTDEDRWPWLNVINSWMVAREALGENTVVSSSALKRSYREVLAKKRAHILHSPQRQPRAHSAEAQRTQGPFHAARAPAKPVRHS